VYQGSSWCRLKKLVEPSTLKARCLYYLTVFLLLILILLVFQGDSIAFIQLPSLNELSKLEQYATDADGDIFRIAAFDHCNEPHSIFHNGTLLDDSTAYFVAPIHWFFIMIALFCRENPECSQAVNMRKVFLAYGISKNLDFSTIFEVNEEMDECKIHWESCFSFFDSILDTIPLDYHSSYENFVTRWSLKDRKELCIPKIAFGMEVLRDLLPEDILLRYTDRAGLMPIYEELVPSGSGGTSTPKSSNKRTKKSVENVTGNMRISSFFKPLEK
jgi:hypothetical protein